MKTHITVIGAGPGGYVAAFPAADLGMQITLIDADPNPGGVCAFRGCASSKVLLQAARVLDAATHATTFGCRLTTCRLMSTSDIVQVNTVMGDFLADAEALLAARLERVSLDDIARQAQPNPLFPQHGAHHHG